MKLPLFDNALWRFSLDLYSDAEWQALCLRLQDEHNVNVNLLQFYAWLRQQKLKLPAEQWPAAIALITPWANHAAWLRQRRRRLRPAAVTSARAAKLKALVQHLELVAEQYQHWLLFDFAAQHGQAGESNWGDFCHRYAIDHLQVILMQTEARVVSPRNG